IDSAQLNQAALLVWETHQSGNKIILVGNGGSAAMASHVAVDFTKATGIRAINFNEADLITCFANDYGYEHWVAKALEAYADSGDLAILISSSGKSLNIINGAEKAKKIGLSVITVSGFLPDNPLRKLGDLNLWVNNSEYNIVEMTHHIWLVAIIDYLIETKVIK
ncbi:MAG: SIS domain-containing protein, partial [Deltaproteobacteria bacterium]|nr:SIS domain-containing protein [Deltaproteobacteria bacterium]